MQHYFGLFTSFHRCFQLTKPCYFTIIDISINTWNRKLIWRKDGEAKKTNKNHYQTKWSYPRDLLGKRYQNLCLKMKKKEFNIYNDSYRNSAIKLTEQRPLFHCTRYFLNFIINFIRIRNQSIREWLFQ